MAPIRILVVDDNEETALLLARLLTRRGQEVRTAFDGFSALAAAQEFQPDVFLLDIGLPGLDGYSLARRLRSEGFPDALFIAKEGESEGLPVWSRHVGDPILKSNMTRRVDFALFMVAALENDELIHEAPAIVGRRTPSAVAAASA